jgi:hypothetical protein
MRKGMGKKLGTKGKKERGHTQGKRREEKVEERDKRETREKKEIEAFWVWGKEKKADKWGFCDCCCNKI